LALLIIALLLYWAFFLMDIQSKINKDHHDNLYKFL
jgi:hypothetical protein